MDSNFSHFVGSLMWGSMLGIFCPKNLKSNLGLNSVSIVETRIIVAIIIIIAGLLCLDKKFTQNQIKRIYGFLFVLVFLVC